MKKCLLLLSIFITLSSGIPNSALEFGIPKFTLLEERSENGNPTILITFPNGYDDKMVLNKYYVNEEEERIGAAEHCNFIGHVGGSYVRCDGHILHMDEQEMVANGLTTEASEPLEGV